MVINCFGKGKMMRLKEMLASLRNIERNYGRLSNLQKVLLTTDGSMTRALEVITGKKVVVETKYRKIVKAGKKLAKELKVNLNEPINLRIVYLKNVNSKNALIFAKSWSPLYRLDERYRNDFTSKDIPIGKIIQKYRIETRRVLKGIWVEKAKSGEEKAFGVKKGELILVRMYYIISGSKILILIEEKFPYSSFK
jgi:beta-ribofuranosylaminobenzene 5'-phosphate synthase